MSPAISQPQKIAAILKTDYFKNRSTIRFKKADMLSLAQLASRLRPVKSARWRGTLNEDRIVGAMIKN